MKPSSRLGRNKSSLIYLTTAGSESDKANHGQVIRTTYFIKI